MYMALERGTVDGIIYSITGGYGWKLQEVSKHIVKLDAQLVVGVICMNKGSWNRLPKDIQAILDNDLHPELMSLLIRDYTMHSKKYWAEFKQMGKMIEPSLDMKKKLRASAMPVWDTWVKKANAKGYQGNQIMDSFKKILRSYGVDVR